MGSALASYLASSSLSLFIRKWEDDGSSVSLPWGLEELNEMNMKCWKSSWPLVTWPLLL